MEQDQTGHGRGFTSYSMIKENRAAIWIPLKDDSAGQSMDFRWAVKEGPLGSVCSGVWMFAWMRGQYWLKQRWWE